MTITNRLSWFFLGALGVVLVSFSLTLYCLARSHLRAQIDQNLEATIHMLVAATELESDDVKWEPSERRLDLGVGDEDDQARWAIHDEAGHLVDRSPNLASPPLVTDDGQRIVLSRRLQGGRLRPILRAGCLPSVPPTSSRIPPQSAV